MNNAWKETLTGLGLSLLGGIAVFLVINSHFNSNPSSPSNGGVDIPDINIPDVTTLPDCQKKPLEGEIAKFFPEANACQQKEYNEFTFVPILANSNSPIKISSGSIIQNSKTILISGNITSARLYINATVDDADYSSSRKNAVYFYIDSGDFGGYLNAVRKNGSELTGDSEGVFLSSDVPKIFIEDLFQPTQVAAKAGDIGSRTIDFWKKLTPGRHITYAYVSKPQYGRITEMAIAYKCDEQPCAISTENN